MNKKGEKVILVDENDFEIGIGEKIETHQEGRLHRAFSIFVFNSKGELLLQKRTKSKYHSGGMWTNTCCGHPRPGENIVDAAHRRLREEMRIDCEFEEIFSFQYRVEFDNNLSEYEYDHVMLGTCDDDPHPDPEEASDWKWAEVGSLRHDIKANPEMHTYWLKISLDKVISYATV